MTSGGPRARDEIESARSGNPTAPFRAVLPVSSSPFCSAQRAVDAFACLGLAAALLAPTFGWFVNGIPGTRRLPEERRSAPWPDGSNWSALPTEFEAWFMDALGWRDELLNTRSRLLVHGLGISPTDVAVIGEDGWLFVTERRMLEVGRGADPLSKSELEAWQRSLEDRRDACARAGAAYMFAIAPEKGELYPKELPSEYASFGPTRMDQIVEHMRAHSDVDIFDFRPVLRAEREHDAGLDLTYFAYGPHWTERGAQAASRVLLDRLEARLPSLYRPEPIPEVWTATGSSGDDWSPRLYLDSLGEQIELVAAHAPRSEARVVGSTEASQFAVTFESEARGAPRLLLVHDSFGMYMRKFLVGSFSRTACYWDTELRPELLESEPADAVVELFVERVLTTRPRAWSTEHLAARFAESSRVVYSFDAASGDARPDVDGASDVILVGGSMLVRAPGSNARVVLPAFPIPKDSVPMVRIDIDSDRIGSLLVSYTTDRERTLTRQNSFKYTLAVGPNTIYAEVVGERIRGSLVLVLPFGAERIRIRSIEARLVPR